jgi:glucans biosynthesis protein C
MVHNSNNGYNHPSSSRARRQDDLDNLRSFLTALMIVHHIAIAYGGSGAWEFKSRCFPAFSLGLTAFNAINQTFFMGLFFYLSGRFARQSMAHVSRNNRKFILSRLLRLGLPSVLYTLILDPALKAFVHFFDPLRTTEAEWTHISDIFWNYWSQLRGVRGTVWYLSLTFIFDILAGVIFPTKFSNFLARLHILRRKASFIPLLWAANVLVSFSVRLIHPIYRTFTPLNLRLALLPQYILAYTWGHASTLLHDRFIFAPLGAAVQPLLELVWSLCASIIGLFALFGLSTRYSSSVLASFEQIMGGFNISALLYAIWNEVSFALVASAMIRVFAKHGNRPIYINVGAYLRRHSPRVLFARYSYAAFLSHALVSLGVEIAVEAASPCSSKQPTTEVFTLGGPVPMTLCVGLTNVFLSCFVGYLLVEYVPGAGQIV